jgi:superfamily I DNA and/or RNA helicase
MEELEIGTSNTEKLKCLVCNKYFSYKRTLKRHSITCGSKESKNINSVQCPDLSCNKSFTNKKMLKSHISQTMAWNWKMNKKRLQLFMVNAIYWILILFKLYMFIFQRMEEDNLFLCARKTVGQNKNIAYLDCHRTGNFQSRSTGVRKIKSQDTNKIGSTCPLSMVWI